MATEWYYAKAGSRRGPVSGRQLKELASRGELASHDLVWCQNLKDWTPAEKVEGLSFVAEVGPPPLPSDRAQLLGPPKRDDRYRKLAIWYRRLNLTVLAAIGGFVVISMVASAMESGSPSSGGTDPAFGGLLMLLFLAVFNVIFAVEVFHVAKGVDWNPVVAVVLVLIPYVNLIPLLIISQRANKTLRAASFEVGFLGAKPPM